MPVAVEFKCHNPNCVKVVKGYPHHVEEIKKLLADPNKANITTISRGSAAVDSTATTKTSSIACLFGCARQLPPPIDCIGTGLIRLSIV